MSLNENDENAVTLCTAQLCTKSEDSHREGSSGYKRTHSASSQKMCNAHEVCSEKMQRISCSSSCIAQEERAERAASMDDDHRSILEPCEPTDEIYYDCINNSEDSKSNPSTLHLDSSNPHSSIYTYNSSFTRYSNKYISMYTNCNIYDSDYDWWLFNPSHHLFYDYNLTMEPTQESHQNNSIVEESFNPLKMLWTSKENTSVQTTETLGFKIFDKIGSFLDILLTRMNVASIKVCLKTVFSSSVYLHDKITAVTGIIIEVFRAFDMVDAIRIANEFTLVIEIIARPLIWLLDRLFFRFSEKPHKKYTFEDLIQIDNEYVNEGYVEESNNYVKPIVGLTLLLTMVGAASIGANLDPRKDFICKMTKSLVTLSAGMITMSTFKDKVIDPISIMVCRAFGIDYLSDNEKKTLGALKRLEIAIDILDKFKADKKAYMQFHKFESEKINDFILFCLRDIDTVLYNDPKKSQWCNSLSTQLTQLRVTMNAHASSMHTRPVPVTIWFYGESGMGKSQLAIKLRSLIGNPSSSYYIGEELAPGCYERPAGAKYDDGYKNQGMTHIDEIYGSASEDRVHNTLSFMNSAYSTSKFQLNPAECSEKAKSFFDSTILTMCSNDYKVNDGTAERQDAVLRRTDYVVFVELSRTTTVNDSDFENGILTDNALGKLKIRIAEIKGSPEKVHMAQRTMPHPTQREDEDAYIRKSAFVSDESIDASIETFYTLVNNVVSLHRERNNDYKNCLQFYHNQGNVEAVRSEAYLEMLNLFETFNKSTFQPEAFAFDFSGGMKEVHKTARIIDNETNTGIVEEALEIVNEQNVPEYHVVKNKKTYDDFCAENYTVELVSAKSKIKILTGNGGSGKTYLLNFIISQGDWREITHEQIDQCNGIIQLEDGKNYYMDELNESLNFKSFISFVKAVCNNKLGKPNNVLLCGNFGAFFKYLDFECDKSIMTSIYTRIQVFGMKFSASVRRNINGNIVDWFKTQMSTFGFLTDLYLDNYEVVGEKVYTDRMNIASLCEFQNTLMIPIIWKENRIVKCKGLGFKNEGYGKVLSTSMTSAEFLLACSGEFQQFVDAILVPLLGEALAEVFKSATKGMWIIINRVVKELGNNVTPKDKFNQVCTILNNSPICALPGIDAMTYVLSDAEFTLSVYEQRIFASYFEYDTYIIEQNSSLWKRFKREFRTNVLIYQLSAKEFIMSNPGKVAILVGGVCLGAVSIVSIIYSYYKVNDEDSQYIMDQMPNTEQRPNKERLLHFRFYNDESRVKHKSLKFKKKDDYDTIISTAKQWLGDGGVISRRVFLCSLRKAGYTIDDDGYCYKDEKFDPILCKKVDYGTHSVKVDPDRIIPNLAEKVKSPSTMCIPLLQAPNDRNVICTEHNMLNAGNGNMLMQIVAKNMVSVQFIGIVSGIGLGARYVLTVSHVLGDMKMGIVTKDYVSYNAKVIFRNYITDTAILEVVDVQMPPFRNITRHFIQSKETFNPTNAYLLMVSDPDTYKGQTKSMFITACVNITKLDKVTIARADVFSEKQEKFALMYNYKGTLISIGGTLTQPGHCGSPLFAWTGSNWKIVGIHHATNGATQERFASVATLDLYKAAIESKLELNVCDSNYTEPLMNEQPDYPEPCCSKSIQPTIAQNENFIQMNIQPIIEPTSEPQISQFIEETHYRSEGIDLKFSATDGVVLYNEPKVFNDCKYIKSYGYMDINYNKRLTKISKTILYDFEYPAGVERTAPAILNIHDPRLSILGGETFIEETKILDDALSRYDRSSRTVLPVVLEQAIHWVVKEWTNAFIKNNVKLYKCTLDEAINGIVTVPASQGIDRSTSPGVPFVQRGITSKREFLVEHSDGHASIDLTSEKGKLLMKELSFLEDQLRLGREINPVYTCVLKDETLKLEKIKNAKTRLIFGCPMTWNLLFRKYFNTLTAGIITSRFDISPKVGINPMSQEWGELYNYMTSNALNGFDADYTNWDSSVPQDLIKAIPQVYLQIFENIGDINSPTFARDQLIRKNLYKHLEQPYVLCGREIVRLTSGLVSGSSLTTFDNSLVNDLICKMVIISSIPPSIKFTYDNFHDNFKVATYGDDCIISVSKDYEKHVDFLKFKSIASAICGMRLTCAAKDGTEVLHKPIHECTFLKRGFRFMSYQSNTYCTAPLEFRSINKQIHYHHIPCRMKFEEHERTFTRLQQDELNQLLSSVAMEYCMYGKLVYDGFVKRMREEMILKDVEGFIPSYNQSMSEVYDYVRNQPPDPSVYGNVPLYVAENLIAKARECLKCKTTQSRLFVALNMKREVTPLCVHCYLKHEFTHIHTCKECKRDYYHNHRYFKLTHQQFNYQCAYSDCKLTQLKGNAVSPISYKANGVLKLKSKTRPGSMSTSSKKHKQNNKNNNIKEESLIIKTKMSAPPTASAGITPTTGESGQVSDISSSTHLATPGNAPNAMEMVTHTSAINNLDNYFYTHFIRFKSFNWTSGQQEGTILSSFRVNPFSFHANLRYVMQMYNTWSGGFEIKMELAGTGFNGGKLMMVRFPPNVAPSTFNINEASVLSYQFLDVKSQGSSVFYIPDFRNVEFHYTNKTGGGDLSEYSNGSGTFVVMVMLPLETSGSIGASVNVQLSARLAKDFCVGQLLPPNITKTPSFMIWESFGKINREKQYVPNMPGFELSSLKINAAKSTTYGVANLRTFINGDWANPQPDNYLRTMLIKLAGQVSDITATGFKMKILGDNPSFDYRYDISLSVATLCSVYCFKASTMLPNRVGVKTITFKDDGIYFVTDHISATDFDNIEVDFMPECYYSPSFSDYVFKDIVSNPRGESMVSFTHGISKPGVLSLQSFDNYIVSGALQGLQKDTTLLFQLIDAETLEPLTFIRWWPEGYWTAPYTKIETLFSLDSIYLKFHSTLTIHANIPAPTPKMNVSRTNYMVRTQFGDRFRITRY